MQIINSFLLIVKTDLHFSHQTLVLILATFYLNGKQKASQSQSDVMERLLGRAQITPKAPEEQTKEVSAIWFLKLG